MDKMTYFGLFACFVPLFFGYLLHRAEQKAIQEQENQKQHSTNP